MRATVSGANRGRPQHAQRGMVTVVVMLFLIATVVFALSQMLNVSSGNVIDGQRQGDSTAAFFLAESGIEQARASLNGTLLLGNLTDAQYRTAASIGGQLAARWGALTAGHWREAAGFYDLLGELAFKKYQLARLGPEAEPEARALIDRLRGQIASASRAN